MQSKSEALPPPSCILTENVVIPNKCVMDGVKEENEPGAYFSKLMQKYHPQYTIEQNFNKSGETRIRELKCH